MRQIYWMRHGSVLIQGGKALLSLEGKKEVKKAAQFSFVEKGITLSRLYSSSKERTLETARIVAKETGYNKEVETLSSLSEGADHMDMEIIQVSLQDGALFVTHLPNLRKAFSYFLASEGWRKEFPPASIFVTSLYDDPSKNTCSQLY